MAGAPSPEQLRERHLRQLRRYALEGNNERLEELLASMIAQDPTDHFAAEELERLHRGERLCILESSRERRERLHREKVSRLIELCNDYTTRRREWVDLPSRQLREYRDLVSRAVPPQQASGFLRELDHLLNRRRSSLIRRGVLAAAGLSLALVIVLGVKVCNEQALALDENLRVALLNDDWTRVEQQLAEADSFTLRLCSQQLRQRIDLAEKWQQQQRAEYARLRDRLVAWQNNPAELAALGEAYHRRYASELSKLAVPHSDLSRRWHELETSLRQEQYHRITRLGDQLRAPLPPLPAMTGDTQADTAAIAAHRRLIEQRRDAFRQAPPDYGFSPDIIEHLSPREKQLDALEQDIAGLQRLIRDLSQADNYRSYTSILKGYAPQAYGPALALVNGVRDLPHEGDLLEHVRNSGVGVPHDILDKALRRGGSSFPAAVPATHEQTGLAEQIFVSVPLNRVFYRYRNAEGATALCEEKAVAIRDVRSYVDVRITRSVFDPNYKVDGENTFVWPYAESVTETVIDATPLLEAAGLERPLFYGGNLPHMLESVINGEAPHCPPLARAYLYDLLRRITLGHSSREVSGLSFSPSMRADFRSFEKLCRECRLNFEDGMWLRESPRHTRLNEIFAAWFRLRQGRHYSREIADNFSEIADIRPHYAGFIGPDGQLILSPKQAGKLPQGSRLWYLSRRSDNNRAAAGASGADGEPALSVGHCGEALDDPIPLSPVFTVK